MSYFALCKYPWGVFIQNKRQDNDGAVELCLCRHLGQQYSRRHCRCRQTTFLEALMEGKD